MPSLDTPTRKLAAIMFTDIAGYTAQMSKDESKALNLLKTKESILKPLIKKHNGTYVKSTGDGSLSYFRSAIDAAICSVKLQEATFEDDNMNIRVGIHLGDIVFKGDDVFGDGVNIAARIESIAPVGGVCVSKNVYDELVNKEGVDGVTLGLQSLKGVGRLIEVFGLRGDKLNEPNPKDYQNNKISVHSDDEVPSVAIIPFRNKGKKEDEFYAYGICADLISDCSSAGLIRVASLERVEELDDIPIEEKVKQLDVRYITTGTLWKMGDKFQLSIELYDTKESKIVWSDRWQEGWDNLPSIKGNLSDGLLKALDTQPKLEKKIETTNIEAYEYYLKGMYTFEKKESIQDDKIAQGLLQKSIELDNNLLIAKFVLGNIYIDTGDLDKAMELFKITIKQGKEIGDESINVNQGIGRIYRLKGDYKNALKFNMRALEIDEKLENFLLKAEALGEIARVYTLMGDCEKGLDYSIRSHKIFQDLESKWELGLSFHLIGIIHWFMGNLDKAFKNSNRSLEIFEKVDTYGWVIFTSFGNLGLYHFSKGNYKKAIEYLEKSFSIQKEIGHTGEMMLWVVVYLFLSYKKVGKKYDKAEIQTLIEETEHIEDFISYHIYLLLEDTDYFEVAYKQVREKADNLEPDIAAKFLEYPFPKAIVEEWEKNY